MIFRVCLPSVYLEIRTRNAKYKQRSTSIEARHAVRTPTAELSDIMSPDESAEY